MSSDSSAGLARKRAAMAGSFGNATRRNWRCFKIRLAGLGLATTVDSHCSDNLNRRDGCAVTAYALDPVFLQWRLWFGRTPVGGFELLHRRACLSQGSSSAGVSNSLLISLPYVMTSSWPERADSSRSSWICAAKCSSPITGGGGGRGAWWWSSLWW